MGVDDGAVGFRMMGMLGKNSVQGVCLTSGDGRIGVWVGLWGLKGWVVFNHLTGFNGLGHWSRRMTVVLWTHQVLGSKV